MSDVTEREVIDVVVGEWGVDEARAFQKKTGAAPFAAYLAIQRAAVASAREREEMYAEGETPDNYLPLQMLSIDPGLMLGFAWITWRRKEPGLSFEHLAAETKMNELIMAFFDAFNGAIGEAEAEEEAPLAPSTEKTSPTSSQTSTSAPATAGDSPTSDSSL